ncbi:hypothetical protein TrVE_jg8199 [Triparma verrucosa]|uniref:Ion transport domain-containing protein n=1 Tax=Triparma verrucosa TaxID=1606542 RepID=A0A9W7CFX9_9STRA|nr:hypothetical protein TrVE_jg8199 [Triparma verrucosa]
MVKVLLEAHPAALELKDVKDKVPIDNIKKTRLFEGIIGGRSLGRDDTLDETMMAAFRETNVKGLESAVEEFAKSPEIFDLFAWQQFLEIHHRNNPDPGYFVVELQLLFEATWTVLTQANPKTDEASKSLTENLKGAIQKYVSDNNKFRPNLLPEFLTTVPVLKLQKLAATRIFRAHLDSYMRSGIMYIYYFEVFLYLIFTAIFSWLSIKFKFSTNGTYEWDDIVIRDMTITCFFLALYFLLRELAQFHAMYQLGLQRNWFKDFWNYIDLVASGGTIVLLEYYFRIGPGLEYEHFASVIALFVWMKVLGFAKAFSQPIATFVLMLSTIFKDLFSLMAVLVIILIMFGHAFYLVLSENKASDGIEIDFSNISGTALSLYLMILGIFESSVFAGIWAQILFLCYSFLVVIILLNVLIAIVSDSYDAVLVNSTELFWQSRLELVAEITTTFNMFLRSDLEKWIETVKSHKQNFEGQLAVFYGFKRDHKWSNTMSKAALGLRVLFSPVLLVVTILSCIWYLPLLHFHYILQALQPDERNEFPPFMSATKKAKQHLGKIFGWKYSQDYPWEDGEWSNKNSKVTTILRVIFSPFLLCYTIGYFLIFFGTVTLCAFVFGVLYAETDFVDDISKLKGNLTEIKNSASIICGFKEDHAWSNKKSKLAILLRALFFPLILILLLLWHLPVYLYCILMLKTQGPRETSTEVDLDLRLDSSNSDWSGRVLDIVRRVNSVTSAEVNKIDARMTAREKKMAAQIENLKEENVSIKKQNTSILKILSSVAEKVGAEIPVEEKNEVEEVTSGQPSDHETEKSQDEPPQPPPAPKQNQQKQQESEESVQNPMLKESGLELQPLPKK